MQRVFKCCSIGEPWFGLRHLCRSTLEGNLGKKLHILLDPADDGIGGIAGRASTLPDERWLLVKGRPRA